MLDDQFLVKFLIWFSGIVGAGFISLIVFFVIWMMHETRGIKEAITNGIRTELHRMEIRLAKVEVKMKMQPGDD